MTCLRERKCLKTTKGKSDMETNGTVSNHGRNWWRQTMSASSPASQVGSESDGRQKNIMTEVTNMWGSAESSGHPLLPHLKRAIGRTGHWVPKRKVSKELSITWGGGPQRKPLPRNRAHYESSQSKFLGNCQVLIRNDTLYIAHALVFPCYNRKRERRFISLIK